MQFELERMPVPGRKVDAPTWPVCSRGARQLQCIMRRERYLKKMPAALRGKYVPPSRTRAKAIAHHHIEVSNFVSARIRLSHARQASGFKLQLQMNVNLNVLRHETTIHVA